MISSRAPTRLADLIEWRKRSDLSLAAIAETTRICVRYLEAIECGNFRALPGGAYSLSYLRQYAEAINYDADCLIEYFHDVMASQDASKPILQTRGPWIGRAWDRIRSFLQVAEPSGILHPRG